MPYIVTFVSKLKDTGSPSYATIARRIEEFLKTQPGYLGMDSVRNSEGEGITVCYWESLEAIDMWRIDERHILAQQQGKAEWYAYYKVIVSESFRSYESGVL